MRFFTQRRGSSPEKKALNPKWEVSTRDERHDSEMRRKKKFHLDMNNFPLKWGASHRHQMFHLKIKSFTSEMKGRTRRWKTSCRVERAYFAVSARDERLSPEIRGITTRCLVPPRDESLTSEWNPFFFSGRRRVSLLHLNPILSFRTRKTVLWEKVSLGAKEKPLLCRIKPLVLVSSRWLYSRRI